MSKCNIPPLKTVRFIIQWRMTLQAINEDIVQLRFSSLGIRNSNQTSWHRTSITVNIPINTYLSTLNRETRKQEYSTPPITCNNPTCQPSPNDSNMNSLRPWQEGGGGASSLKLELNRIQCHGWTDYETNHKWNTASIITVIPFWGRVTKYDGSTSTWSPQPCDLMTSCPPGIASCLVLSTWIYAHRLQLQFKHVKADI